MPLELIDLVKRPSLGKAGKPIRVRANFFEVTAFPANNIYHYDVQFEPASTPVAIYRKVWHALEKTGARGIFNGIKTIFDGRKNAFSPKALPLGEEQAASFEVEWNEEDERGAPKRSRGLFTIKIRKAGEVVMEELHRFLNSQASLSNNCLTAIMVLDVLIRYLPSLDYPTLGRSLFTGADARPLPNGIEVWQGYFQSARPAVGKMMINVDVSATAFNTPGPLPDSVAKILGRRSLDELRRGIPERELKKLEKFLKNIRIQVVHRGNKKLKYKVTGLTASVAERTMFRDDTGNEMSVAQYFVKQYNLGLNFPFLPCVIVRKDIFLPMEVCSILPGQRYGRKLNEAQTAEMIKFTCQKPNVRANKITSGLSMLQHQNNPYMEHFGMAVKPEMAVVKARVLNPPKISYHPSSQEADFTPQGGAWNLRGKKVAQGATLGSWSVVNFAGRVPRPAIQKFLRELIQTFADTGLSVINRTPPISDCDPQGNIDKALKEAWLQAGNAAKANPQLIVCILPNAGVPLYAEIKRVTDTVIGVPSQCLQSKHIGEPKKQYCANVCLKVNMKLGGTNLFLSPPQIPFISQRPTVVFGADVTYPAHGDQSGPSIAALTASMDARAARYSSVIRLQIHRTEIISDLANMVKEVLKNFYKECGQKPERILFYRDGVSEGQFKQVMDAEVAAIKAACASLDRNYHPTLTFVVVQKRHHARFFPMDARESDRTGNCLPGTVIDTEIVHPFEFDFYLQSHAGLIGTCRPTHYHVLHDENNFTPDALQELTYRLCYTYGRATRAVSLVPAAYYADLVAARARFHRHGENWSDTDVSSDVTASAEEQLAMYANVKADLLRVMYFM